MSLPRSDVQHRIYLAGPMQGIREFNFPRFHAVSAALRAQGHIVFSPAEKDIERHAGVDISKGNETGSLAQSKTEHKFSLRQALDEDLHFICTVSTLVVMLPGWERSNGSQSEQRTAAALYSEGVDLHYLTEDDCKACEREFAGVAPEGNPDVA